jgi:hypothetical protein
MPPAAMMRSPKASRVTVSVSRNRLGAPVISASPSLA